MDIDKFSNQCDCLIVCDGVIVMACTPDVEALLV